MDIKQKYYLWNYGFTAILVVILFLFLAFLEQPRIDSSSPSFIVVLLLSLATYRITRAITKDKIFAHMREVIEKNSKKNSFMYTIHELIICVWCTSMWVALFLTILTYLIPSFVVVLVIFSISAVGSIIQCLMAKV